MNESFYYILLSISLVSILLAWIKSGTIANPITLYILWWGGFLFLSGFNFIGIRMPGMKTYSLFLLNLGMFSLGGITFLGNSFLREPGKINHTKFRKIDLFFQFQIVVTIILVLINFRTAHLLKNLDPGTIRGMIYTNKGVLGSYGLYFTYFVKPFIFGSAFISIAGVLLGRLPKRYYLLSFINLVLLSTATIGRLPIFLAVLSTLIGFVFLLSTSKIKIKIRYVLIFLIPISMIISVSIFRKSNINSNALSIIGNYFIWYFTGPFSAFDYFLNVYKPGIDYDYSICRGFLAGFEGLFDPIIRRINPSFREINHSFHEITAPFRSLGGSATNHNSHYTMLFTFFRDAGVAGIIIYSYILGVINSLLFNHFRKNNSIVTFSLLLITVYLSLMGLFKWEFRYFWSTLTIAVIIAFGQKIVLKKKTT